MDGTAYSLVELTELINKRIETGNTSNNEVKIDGDKDADYGTIFDLISLCKARDLRPILSFKE